MTYDRDRSGTKEQARQAIERGQNIRKNKRKNTFVEKQKGSRSRTPEKEVNYSDDHKELRTCI